MDPGSAQAVFGQAGRDSVFILPQIMLAVFGVAILLTDRFLPQAQKRWHAFTALLGLAFSGAALGVIARISPRGISAFSDSIAIEPFFVYFGWLCLAVAALVILLSARYLAALDSQGEIYTLLLFATLGMMFLACGNDLVVLFVGIEIFATSLTVLIACGAPHDSAGGRKSAEAAVKQGIMTALAAAILAYGFSLLYGIGGSTNLRAIAEGITRNPAGAPLAFAALAAICAALFVQLAAAPFHEWMPDSCQAALGPVAAYAAIGAKVAAFALLLRLLLTIFWPLCTTWAPILAIVAAVSIIAGTLASLTQSNTRRLLGYLSIVQVGFILLGLVAAVGPNGSVNERGLQAVAYYLFVFAFFGTGAFSLVISSGGVVAMRKDLNEAQGFTGAAPGTILLMLVFLFSLAGVPPTAGFIGIWLVVSSLVATGHKALALLAVACLPLAVYSSLRLARAVWRPATGLAATWERASWMETWGLAVAAAVTLGAGIFPERLLHFAQYSMLSVLAR